MTRKRHEPDASQSDRRHPAIMYTEFVNDGYIRVHQDIRGLHHSEGQFVMNRPIVGPLNNTGIDESTDAYDTIDWLVKNMPESNGKVGDDRLVLSRLHDAGVGDQSAPGAQGRGSAEPDGRRLDGRRLVPQRRVPRRRARLRRVSREPARRRAAASRSARATITRAISKPGRWRTIARRWASRIIRSSEVSPEPGLHGILVAAGGRQMARGAAAYGADDARGRAVGPGRQLRRPRRLQGARRPKDKGNDLVHLAIGPWRHSGANHYGYDLGALTFTGDTAQEWRAKYVKPFFDHYLKGAPDPQTPTGAHLCDRRQRVAACPRWPMGTPKPIYLAADGVAGV